MSVGRSLGYALNGVRQSTLAYDPATGRLASMLAAGSDTPFTWSYLPGSDLKSSLAYGDSMVSVRMENGEFRIKNGAQPFVNAWFGDLTVKIRQRI